jgi:hypothetical protein
MFVTCLLVLVGGFVVVAVSALSEGRALAILAWAFGVASLLAVVLAWGSLTAQAFSSSRHASHHLSADGTRREDDHSVFG